MPSEAHTYVLDARGTRYLSHTTSQQYHALPLLLRASSFEIAGLRGEDRIRAICAADERLTMRQSRSVGYQRALIVAMLLNNLQGTDFIYIEPK